MNQVTHIHYMKFSGSGAKSYFLPHDQVTTKYYLIKIPKNDSPQN